jgi:hypothetical protein
VVIVAAASQLDVPDGGLATDRVGPHVVELHEGALTAPVAVRSHERAPERSSLARHLRSSNSRRAQRTLCRTRRIRRTRAAMGGGGHRA